MKLQTEAPKPDWSKEAARAVDCPHQAADNRTAVASDEKPNLGVRIVNTAKSVARQLWVKKMDTCCILSQNNVFLSEKGCIGKLLHVQQLMGKFVKNRAGEVEKS